MSKCLVYIQGFPRSGTTFLNVALRGSDSCYSPKEEQGLHRVWDIWHRIQESGFTLNEIADCYYSMMDTVPDVTPEHLLTEEVFWMGEFVWKNMKSLSTTFLESWCIFPPDREFTHYVSKTPMMRHIPDWPSKFVEESSKFDQYKVLCSIRDPENNYMSGISLFPHWRRSMPPERFFKMWFDFYENQLLRNDPNFLPVPHGLMLQDQGALNRIGKWLGVKRIPPKPYGSKRYGGPEWLSQEDRKRARDLIHTASDMFYHMTDLS